MTHRGATGADSRDGDGAGVMTAIPHHFFKRESEQDIGCTLPEPGEYAVGNFFFKPNDPVQLQSHQALFSKLAIDLGLRVLGWRKVPTDGTILVRQRAARNPLSYNHLSCSARITVMAILAKAAPSTQSISSVSCEINTVRGNKNWMRAREGVLSSQNFGDQLDLLYPIIETGGSDSAAFDNVLELLVVNGVVTLPEAIMMLIPEAWQGNEYMEPQKKAFYSWAACLQEPWDGPALFTFSDGRFCGANLDRNGLRPCRFIVTSEDIMICASELKPGRMLLVDTVEGRIVDDKELKRDTASKQNFASWVEAHVLHMPNIVKRTLRGNTRLGPQLDDAPLSTDPKLLAFGYTVEQLSLLLLPMVSEGKEALGPWVTTHQ
ncbi:NADPH-dependent glutamate synthase [Salix suchowensis]|nr:NADPH-dependent glutamate synthase [Salix suchowensis]